MLGREFDGSKGVHSFFHKFGLMLVQKTSQKGLVDILLFCDCVVVVI